MSALQLLVLMLIIGRSDGGFHAAVVRKRAAHLPRLRGRATAESTGSGDAQARAQPGEPEPERKSWRLFTELYASEEESWPEFFEDASKPYWQRRNRVEKIPTWPVGGPAANPDIGGRQGLRQIQWFRGLFDDMQRKAPLYTSDWVNGVLDRPDDDDNSGDKLDEASARSTTAAARSSPVWTKTLASVSFLYFACLAPVIAFGGAMAGLTQGAMGVVEVIASCGICGMIYAIFAGQPMTFVAPTGLTLAFTAALYRCAPLRVACLCPRLFQCP
jgi:hypothetical protein